MQFLVVAIKRDTTPSYRILKAVSEKLHAVAKHFVARSARDHIGFNMAISNFLHFVSQGNTE